VPLYPQYAAATTATACDQAFRALMSLRSQPAVRIVPPYFDEPAYIDAIAASMRDYLAKLDFEPEALIASFHGMPVRYAEQGDPYHGQCLETARLMRERLGWPEAQWHTTFQSRFGRDPWLEPYTIDTVMRLAKSGVKRLAVVAPGFAADCLETLEELDMENRQAFVASGGEKFAYIPCLNAGQLGMRVIERIVRRELAGWI
jgi:ferrochelatase